MQKILITLLFLTLLTTGCAYKIEIQQGNVVSQAQVEKLKIGQSRKQVRSILGSPLIKDAFHPDRWDYYYSRSRAFEVKEQYNLTLYFSGDQLTRIEKQGEFSKGEYQKPEEE